MSVQGVLQQRRVHYERQLLRGSAILAAAAVVIGMSIEALVGEITLIGYIFNAFLLLWAGVTEILVRKKRNALAIHLILLVGMVMPGIAHGILVGAEDALSYYGFLMVLGALLLPPRSAALYMVSCFSAGVIGRICRLNLELIDATAAASLSDVLLGGTAMISILFFMTLSRAADDDLLVQAAREAQHAREDAVRANRVKSALLNNMSHELRTPLGAILGYSELMELENDINEDMRADLQSIKISARHLLTMVDNVLESARLETENLTIRPHHVNIQQMLGELAGLAAPLIKRNQNTLRIEVNTDKTFFTDEQLLRQVLLNLLSNAAKFTNNGLIVLTAEQRGELLYCSVTDTGRGISEDDLRKLFIPFSRVGDTSNTGGMGLGLSLAQRFTELMNGRIEAKSTLGEGATFTVVISETTSRVPPALVMNQPSAPSQEPSSPLDKPTKS